jgi:uncharacterized protein (UPF0335 family)
MELIYFISGILTVGVAYGTYLLTNIKKSSISLMAQNTRTIQVFTRRIEDLDGEVSQLSENISRIVKEMSTDNYESITLVKEHLLRLDEATKIDESNLMEANRVFNKNIVDIHNDLSTVKRNISAIQQDPNIIDRY